MAIIALWCGNRHIHNFRSQTLFQYICEAYRDKPQNLICSGGPTNGKIIPESTIMRQKLEKMWMRDLYPHISLFEESLSTDTAKNIRNSLLLILEKNLIIPEGKVEIFTSHFHIERTRQFAEFIMNDEFPEFQGLQFEMISAENFATQKQKERLLNHHIWKQLHQFFEEWEQRWLSKKVEDREYNRPPHRLFDKK